MNLDKAQQITDLMKKREFLEEKKYYFFDKTYNPIIGAIGTATSTQMRYPVWFRPEELGISSEEISTIIREFYKRAMDSIDDQLSKL